MNVDQWEPAGLNQQSPSEARPPCRKRFFLFVCWLALAGSVAAITSCAESAAQTWVPIGLSGGGGMFTPAISPADPNLMMINCDMSGAYLSEDGGQHWHMINQAQLRSDIRCRPAFHPRERNIIYASSGGRLKRSRDGGNTFSPLGNLSEALAAEIAISPANPTLLLAGTSNGRCWVSIDSGVSWKACPGPEGRIIGFYFENTGKDGGIWAATERGIWRSDDQGHSWVEKDHGLPWNQLQGFAGGSRQQRVVLYCTVQSKVEAGAFKGGIYRSADRGDSWEPAVGKGLNTEISKADEYSYGNISQYREVLASDARPLTVFVCNTSTGFHPPHFDTVYRSDDAGENWRPVYFMDPRFKQFNVGYDYVTASCGQSFKGGETPFGIAICNSDPERLLLVRDDCQVTHSGGQNWFCGSTTPAPGQIPKPGSTWLCNGLVVTTTWHYYIDPFEPNRHYIAYTDLGWAPKTWAPWRNTCYEIAFDPEIRGKIWGAFSDVHDIPNDNIISERHGHNRPGGVCLSTDFGASWKPTGSGGEGGASAGSVLPRKAVTSVVVDAHSPKDLRTLYAGVFEAGVFKSTDDGKSWLIKTNGLGHPQNLRVSRLLIHQDGTLFAMICAKRPAAGKPLLSEGVGLWRSRDGAECWEKVNASELFLYPKDFSVHPRDSRRMLVGVCDTNWQDRAGGLYYTADGGKSWERIGREGSQTFGGYFHPNKEGWIYMSLTEGAPGAGLWLSRDNGRTWKAFEDVPFANAQRVEFDLANPDQVYLTTFGGSVWRGPAEPR